MSSTREARLAEIRRLYRQLPPRAVYREAAELDLIRQIYAASQAYLAQAEEGMTVVWW